VVLAWKSMEIMAQSNLDKLGSDKSTLKWLIDWLIGGFKHYRFQPPIGMINRTLVALQAYRASGHVGRETLRWR
jgi:hypothetical protein